MEQTRPLLPEDGHAAGRVAPSPTTRQEPNSVSKKSASSVRMPMHRSPHEAKTISASNSRLIKGLSARIQLHCAPTHNWESRRKDLRDSVRVFLLCSLMAACAPASRSKHCLIAADASKYKHVANLLQASTWLAWPSLNAAMSWRERVWTKWIAILRMHG